MSTWIRVKDKLPPERVEVDTMSETGQVQTLKLMDGLWWFPDMSMYVYYQVSYWRPLGSIDIWQGV